MGRKTRKATNPRNSVPSYKPSTLHPQYQVLVAECPGRSLKFWYIYNQYSILMTTQQLRQGPRLQQFADLQIQTVGARLQDLLGLDLCTVVVSLFLERVYKSRWPSLLAHLLRVVLLAGRKLVTLPG